MLDREDAIDELAALIVRKCHVKSFPDEYLVNSGYDRIEIPVGSDIIMFRKDEFTVVSIDAKQVYSMSRDEAKYIYYSAKRGHQYVPDPSKTDLPSLIQQFEADLDEVLKLIGEYTSGWKDPKRDMLKLACSQLLGYHEIF